MPFLPKDAANACIRRSRRYLATAEGKLPDTKIRNDLRRSALVLAVAAIDSYMHWLVFRRISEVRREGDLPNSLKRFEIPFANLASLADHVISSRRDRRRKIRPWVAVKKAFQDQLLKETFQTFDQLANAMAMAGIEKSWSKISDHLGMPVEQIKIGLDYIVHRRNQIVHEGDIARASRPQETRYNQVIHDDVVSYIDWIESLLTAIEAVIANP